MTADRFERSLWLSVAGHCAILSVLLLRAVFVPHENLIIRNAIRVDVVGLPEKMTEPPKILPQPAADTPAPPAPTKPTPPPPTKTAAPSVPVKSKSNLAAAQKEALNKLKAQDALEKIKNDVTKSKAAAAAAAIIKGNKVAQGNSLTGLDKIEYDRYFDDLKTKVLSQWSIPQWLADLELKAQVQVFIDERGLVIKKLVRRSSGNEIFDAKALEAIDASSPLPVPPERLRGVLSTSGIIFVFPE